PRRRSAASSGSAAGSAVTIECLQHEESLLLLAVVGDEPLAVPAVLDLGQRAARRLEVVEDPRRQPAPDPDALHHRELVLIHVGLIVLGPALFRRTAMPRLGVAAELAEYEWLLVSDVPGERVAFRRQSIVPTDVLVDSQHVQIFAQRVVHDLRAF